MSKDMQASARVVGTLRAVDGTGVVRMEDRYDTDIDDLWSALTDPPRLARWIAEVQGDLRIGGEFQARFTSGWEGTGRVDVCAPPRRLLVTMSPGQGEHETVIEAELVADGDQTQLVVEERGLPLGELAAHGAGWQAHIEDLAAYLAGRQRLDWRTRWTELTPTYRVQADDLA
ncbi:MAG: SRPBCC family protein [Nocardioidaceae bacterium]